MVSIKTLIAIGVALSAFGIYKGLGGARGIGTAIGSNVGGAFTAFGDSLTSSFSNAFSFFGSSGADERNDIETTTVGQQIKAVTGGAGGNSIFANAWQGLTTQINDIFGTNLYSQDQRGDIIQALNRRLEQNNVNASINANGVLHYGNGLGDQQLPINQQGEIGTGTAGLHPDTVAAQKKLADKYNIVTFDTAGNISQWGGI